MNLTRGVSTMRGAVTRKAEEKWGPVGSFAYGVGMSMADFLTQAGATGALVGGGDLASNLTLGIMGSSAAANTTMECVDRGLSNRQAYTLGAVAGMAEILTERVSLEALLDRTSLGKNAVGYLVKNVLAEGSEEVASDLINLVADVVVAKDKSQWRQAVADYRAQGYSEAEAFGLAMKDQAMDMGMSFLGGALSGGVMAGGSVAVNGINQYFKREHKTASGEEIGISYTQEEIGQIQREGKTFRNLVAGIDMSVSEFLQKWKNGRQSQQGEKLEKLYLGKMSQEVQKQVGSILGYEVGDRDFIITSDGAKHIISGHGDAAAETARGNLPLTQAIIDALPEIVAHPDSIAPGKPEKKSPHRIGIIFKKNLSDGTAVYIQFDNSSRGTFEGRTLYVKKEESSSSGTPASKETGILTSETTEPELSSNSILPQREEEGKAKKVDVSKPALTDDTTADALLRERTSVNFLTRKGGLELKPGMTQVEKRQAVKKAVEQIARRGKDGFSERNTEEKAGQKGLREEGLELNGVFKPGKEEKQQGPKPVKQEQAFKPVKDYLNSDGKLDQERVKQDYRKFLQGVPEKNRMYLEQALEAAEFEVSEDPEIVFSYNGKTDKFLYNPSNKAFGYYDMEVMLTHDLAHRIDKFFVRAAENKRFTMAIENAGKILEANPDFFVQYCEKNDQEGFCSDILSAICKDKYRFPIRHDAEYWNAKTQAGEIFANLFSLQGRQHVKKLNFLREHFPELIASFEALEFYIH